MPMVTAPDGQRYNLGYRRRAFEPKSVKYNLSNYRLPAVDLTQPRVFWGSNPDPRLAIEDQQQMGSCSSFGAASAATESERMQGAAAAELDHDWLYWQARVKENGWPADSGSDPADILDFCMSGAPPQSAQAGGYVDNAALAFPQLNAAATLKYVASFHAIYPTDTPNMESLVWASLDQGYPVVMATLWTAAMFTPSKGLMPTNQTPAQQEGGHCIRCYGIVNGWYLCDNQWNTSWSPDAAASGFPGMRPGSFAMPWAYGKPNSLIEVMYSVVGVSVPQPTPQPTPTPTPTPTVNCAASAQAIALAQYNAMMAQYQAGKLTYDQASAAYASIISIWQGDGNLSGTASTRNVPPPPVAR